MVSLQRALLMGLVELDDLKKELGSPPLDAKM
jgi:hypothetical protein